MTEYFAIGDVHGKAGMLDELLQHWDDRSQLVFLGDLIDRGEDSRAVLERVKDLVDQEGAVCLSGNHEYMFLTWLDNPEKSYDHYRRNGGDTTINSLLGQPLNAPVDGVADAERVKTEAANLVDFIRQMPFLLETERYIFVHAGLDLELRDWRETSVIIKKFGFARLFTKAAIRLAKRLSLAIHQHFTSCIKHRELISYG